MCIFQDFHGPFMSIFHDFVDCSSEWLTKKSDFHININVARGVLSSPIESGRNLPARQFW